MLSHGAEQQKYEQHPTGMLHATHCAYHNPSHASPVPTFPVKSLHGVSFPLLR